MTMRFIVTVAVTATTGALLALAAWSQDLPTRTEASGASPVFGVVLPPGYRDWRVISVAHEAGNNNDIRVILGNQVAIAAFRKGQVPYPDGTVIARLAWKYQTSAQNNTVFGREQSFVAGEPTNVQISVKDSVRFARTGGWGYGQFEEGKANPSETVVNSCFACHRKLPPARDFVFTDYAR